MLRRLFAILALITGLTAFAVPANAWGDPSDARAVSIGEMATTDAKGSCDCTETAECTSPTSDKKRGETKRRKSVVVRIPRIVIGADRALE